MLHIVNRSHAQTTSLQSCLRLAQGGSALLLIEDAVYAATAAWRRRRASPPRSPASRSTCCSPTPRRGPWPGA